MRMCSVRAWCGRAALWVCMLQVFLSEGVRAERAAPNVIIILADDLRPDFLELDFVHAPHVRALAKEGRVFRNAYNLGSWMQAVCLPSRNMFLSGKAYFRWSGPWAPADGQTFPEVFGKAGYQTYYHGKQYNTAPLIEAKFQIHRALADEDRERRSGEPGRRIADSAIRFLESAQRERAKPLLMLLAFEAPHDPWFAAERYRSRIVPGSIRLPANWLPMHPFDNGEMTPRDELLENWPRTEAVLKRAWFDYAAVVSGLDEQVGRVLEAVRRCEAGRGTIVVFTSDNGLALGSHGLLGKQNLYEHSVRLPLIVAGTGVSPGVSDGFVYLMDLFPTLCERAGIEAPSGIDGRSFAACLDGRAETARERVALAYRDVQRGLREGSWKLIWYPHINKFQIFDLSKDPGERVDRSGEAALAGRVASMHARMAAELRMLGDSVPMPGRAVERPFTPPRGEVLRAMRKAQGVAEPGQGG